jgi:hypothetical protein
MPTVIAGKGLGGISTRVTTDDPRVIKLLAESERVSFGRHARRQGAGSGTWWCGQKAVAAVEQLIAESSE